MQADVKLLVTHYTSGISSGNRPNRGICPLAKAFHSEKLLSLSPRAKARASEKGRYFLSRGAIVPVPNQSPQFLQPLPAYVSWGFLDMFLGNCNGRGIFPWQKAYHSFWLLSLRALPGLLCVNKAFSHRGNAL